MSRYARIRGKALLVIERLDSKWVPFDVTPFIQSCSDPRPEGRDCVKEDFQMCSSVLPLPSIAHKLKVGEVARVSVVYEFEYTTDYWGESDVYLTYHKERVLRRHRARERYVPKVRALAVVRQDQAAA